MKRLALVALAGMILTGCGKSDIDRAREAVAEKLNDPRSAQFRNERSEKGGWVCGEVNGKNAFGGYIGFKRYTVTWMPDGSNVVALEGENETSVDRINCGIQ